MFVPFFAVAEFFGCFGQNFDGGFELVLDLLLNGVHDAGRAVEVVDVFGSVEHGGFGFLAGELLGDFFKFFRVAGRWHVGAFDLLVGGGALGTDSVRGFGFDFGVGVVSLFGGFGVQAVD